MAETKDQPQNPQGPQGQGAQSQGAPMQIAVGAQYVKDLSFESPNAPQVFAPTQSQPEINLGVNVHTRNLAERNFEVLLALRLEAKLDGKLAFIAELAYGGVFALPPMPEDQMRVMLLVECPRILFPFARQVLMSAVRDGGFPHIMVAPIDFGALYLANKDKIGSMPTAGAA